MQRLLAAPGSSGVTDEAIEEVIREVTKAQSLPTTPIPPQPSVEDLTEPQWAVNIVQQFQNATVIFNNLQTIAPGEDTPMVDAGFAETYGELKAAVEGLQQQIRDHSLGNQGQWKWLASGCEHFEAQVLSETTITRERIEKLEQVVAAQDAMFRELRAFTALISAKFTDMDNTVVTMAQNMDTMADNARRNATARRDEVRDIWTHLRTLASEKVKEQNEASREDVRRVNLASTESLEMNAAIGEANAKIANQRATISDLETRILILEKRVTTPQLGNPPQGDPVAPQPRVSLEGPLRSFERMDAFGNTRPEERTTPRGFVRGETEGQTPARPRRHRRRDPQPPPQPSVSPSPPPLSPVPSPHFAPRGRELYNRVTQTSGGNYTNMPPPPIVPNRQYIKPIEYKTPATFAGDGKTDFDTWWISVKRFIRNEDDRFRDDEHKVGWVGSIVTGKALAWWNGWMKRVDKGLAMTGWAAFEFAICKAYKNKNQNRKDLSALKAVEYEGDIQSFMATIDSLNITVGLQGVAYRDFILGKLPQTIRQRISMATRAEDDEDLRDQILEHGGEQEEFDAQEKYYKRWSQLSTTKEEGKVVRGNSEKKEKTIGTSGIGSKWKAVRNEPTATRSREEEGTQKRIWSSFEEATKGVPKETLTVRVKEGNCGRCGWKKGDQGAHAAIYCYRDMNPHLITPTRTRRAPQVSALGKRSNDEREGNDEDEAELQNPKRVASIAAFSHDVDRSEHAWSPQRRTYSAAMIEEHPDLLLYEEEEESDY
jgi:uncharacterized coiled-coil protein SlyX